MGFFGVWAPGVFPIPIVVPLNDPQTHAFLEARKEALGAEARANALIWQSERELEALEKAKRDEREKAEAEARRVPVLDSRGRIIGWRDPADD